MRRPRDPAARFAPFVPVSRVAFQDHGSSVANIAAFDPADSIGRCNGSVDAEVVVAKAGRPGWPVAVRALFWDGIRSGLGAGEAAAAAGVSRRQGRDWFRAAGGVAAAGAVTGSGRYLSLAEREEIAVG